MKDNFEISILESGEIIRKGAKAIINNIGRVIATITLVVVALVLFCDVGFADITSESFTTTAFIMLCASYLMYFSMEEAGERLGEESDEYQSAFKSYIEKCNSISGDKIASLREFCKNYSKEDLIYRRSNMLLQYGYSEDDYKKYREGSAIDKASRRIFKKADRLRALTLTPSILLDKSATRATPEFTNPERRKLLKMIVGLIPTTICMCVTVSIILTAKSDIGIITFIEGLLKIGTLLVIGFRGYSGGYIYAKRSVPPWLIAKCRLIDEFLKL